MSWQILQVNGNGGLLRYRQGHIEWCKYKKNTGLQINNRDVVETAPCTFMSNTLLTVVWQRAAVDIKAIILMGYGNTVDGELLFMLGKHDIILLHLDHMFKVTTWTMRPAHITNSVVYANQHTATSLKQTQLWTLLLSAKYRFQEEVAGERLGVITERVTEIEGAVASRYFKHLFRKLDYWGIRDQDSKDGVNSCLNFGYAVLTSLVHRALLICGLDPCWGVGHKYRTRAFALVYDVVEPVRGYADNYLLKIYKEHGRVDLQLFKSGFVKYLAETETVEGLLKTRADWIDELGRSVATFYGNKFARTIITPR